MDVFIKTDEDILDYDIDLSSWLPPGDEIDSVQVTVPSGINHSGKQIFTDRVKIWIGGGTAGEEYTIKALINTEVGRTKEVNFILIVEAEL